MIRNLVVATQQGISISGMAWSPSRFLAVITVLLTGVALQAIRRGRHATPWRGLVGRAFEIPP
jgi:hypothetical protein